MRNTRDGAIHVAHNVGSNHGLARSGRGFDENISPPFVPMLEYGGFDTLLKGAKSGHFVTLDRKDKTSIFRLATVRNFLRKVPK